ncbi:MAG: DNA replication protein DnaD [Phycisphaerales bacterium]|nr:DNA replication protein DnaD [Phycisphaerales bacterium]
MAREIVKATIGHKSPSERIKRTNEAGMEFWSSRDFAEVLGYGDYRNFEGVIEKTRLSCFSAGNRPEDHFVDITEMVAIGSGAERPIKAVLLSRKSE